MVMPPALASGLTDISTPRCWESGQSRRPDNRPPVVDAGAMETEGLDASVHAYSMP